MLKTIHLASPISLGFFLAFSPVWAEDAPHKVDFRTDVAPILQQFCVDCHGPEMQMAELRLDQRQFVLEDDGRGLIKPGDSEGSLLVQRLVDPKLGILMPPTFPFLPGEKAGLAEDQIKILRAWIDEGAAWPEGISLSSAPNDAAADPGAAKLFIAIRNGDRAAVEKLAASKKHLSTREQHGETPLMHAALYGDAEMVKLLLAQGVDVHATSGDGATALHRAAGDVEKVRLLLAAGSNVDGRTKLGRTPLLIACAYPGNVESVKLLLAHGANVKDKDHFKETCLTSAAKRGDAEMVKTLVAAGADVMAGSRPPLVWAAEEGNLETVACLLECGAGKAPPIVTAALASAAARGPAEAVRLLLESGADPNAASGFGGYTPLMLAAYSENVSIETVELLLSRGANPNAKAPGGETPLSLARKRGNTAIVKILEKSDAKTPAPSGVINSGGQGTEPEKVKAAAEKSLALLQECGPKFFAASGCVACHQQSVTSLAVAEAKKRGLKFDEQTAREQIQITAFTVKTYRERFLERVDHPAGSAPSTGYIALGLAAEGYPADASTDAMIIELAGRQQTDGSWTAFGHRPPLEYSRISATALAVRALQLYGPPGLRSRLEKQVGKGRDWLLAARPASNADHAFRLLGLAWCGANETVLQAEIDALLSQQRDDGGWPQQRSMESDAFATGLTMYALREGGKMPVTHDAYRRGIEYLLKTQLADGSWQVTTRSFPFQAYFESGFPHGPDQWISASATGFASIALMNMLPAAEAK